MMGKIPVFVNTDCLLPFDKQINWQQHVVWVEWSERHLIAEKVINFHNRLTSKEFRQLQIDNRNLWKVTLSSKGMLQLITNKIVNG